MTRAVYHQTTISKTWRIFYFYTGYLTILLELANGLQTIEQARWSQCLNGDTLWCNLQLITLQTYTVHCLRCLLGCSLTNQAESTLLRGVLCVCQWVLQHLRSVLIQHLEVITCKIGHNLRTLIQLELTLQKTDILRLWNDVLSCNRHRNGCCKQQENCTQKNFFSHNVSINFGFISLLFVFTLCLFLRWRSAVCLLICGRLIPS